MRKPWGVTALIAGLALLFSAGAMPAYADPGNNGNPGNNNPGQNNTNNPGAEGAANPGNNNPGQNNTNNPGAEGASGTSGSGMTGGAAGGTGGSGGGVGQTGDPPGANGTVKIHDWPEHKNSSDMANDPKVCQFEIHGFTFDAAQTGRWWIQEHKWGNGDASKAVLSGSYAASGGDWTSGPHRLDDGHYKLYVELTHTAGNSGNTVTTYKMKVFKVECEEAPPTGQAGDQSRTETETVCEEDMRVTITRVYRNNVLQSETRTETAEACGTTSGESGDTRTESVCVAGYMVQRIYVNGSLANVTSTGAVCESGSTGVTPNAVAGFESMPSGGLDHMQPGAVADSQSAALGSQSAVAGSQSAPAELAAIASLPATSTAPDAPLGLIGLVLTSLGAALLRRTEHHN